MAYYNICAHCGCSLDPGEKCDCESTAQALKKQNESTDIVIMAAGAKDISLIKTGNKNGNQTAIC